MSDKDDILNNPRVQLLINATQEVLNEMIIEMSTDIMQLKSFSQAEAMIITINLLRRGIMPKTDEFYKYIEKTKTAWEY